MTREEAVEVLKERYLTCVGIGLDNHANRVNEAIDMAIEALQGDMYCPNCGVRLVPENEYLDPTQTHRRLIDADALIAKVKPHIDNTCKFLKPKELVQYINELPTVQADRPHGEWIESKIPNELYVCSNCGGACWSYDYERTTVKSNFCPNCGADMRKENK